MQKGLILVVADWQQLSAYVEADILSCLAQQKNTRPTTWLIPFKPHSLPDYIVGEHKTVAVRLSHHPVVKALVLAVGMPIVSTSANPAACMPAREAFQCRRYFANNVFLCRGRIGKERKTSQIRDLITGKLLRP